MTRILLTVLISICLLGVGGRAFALGTIQMSSSADATTGVTISVTVMNDPGGDPGGLPCGKIGVTRGYGGPVVGVINRQPGTTFTAQVIDAAVQPNTLYCYRVVLLSDFWGPYCNFDQSSICSLFDCFCDVSTCINTGPGPAFMGHGFLSTLNTDGNETRAMLYPCSGDTNNPIMGFTAISGTAVQYVDSGIAVDVYGEPLCCWAQCVWLTSATAATPHSCVLATEQKTWGAVKALYRN